MVDRRTTCAAFEVGADHLDGTVERDRLVADIGGHARRRLTPVQEDLGDVCERSGALREAQQQIVVLRAVGPGSEPADVDDGRPSRHHQMGDVVVVAQPFEREVGLVDGRRAPTVGAQQVVIGVDDVDARVGVEPLRDDGERIGREDIVMVDEHDEVTRRDGQRLVRRRDDATVLGSPDHRASHRAGRRPVEQGPHVRASRRIVDDDVLERAVVGLGVDRCEACREMRRLRVEDRRQHAEPRAHRPRFSRGTTDEVQRRCTRSSARSQPVISMRRCSRSWS